MEFKILKQVKNPFLHREEYTVQMDSESNPSFADVKKELGTKEELTIVKKVDANFGRHTFNADVVVYDSQENMNKVEKISRKQRRKLAEEAKAAAAKPAA